MLELVLARDRCEVELVRDRDACFLARKSLLVEKTVGSLSALDLGVRVFNFSGCGQALHALHAQRVGVRPIVEAFLWAPARPFVVHFADRRQGVVVEAAADGALP